MNYDKPVFGANEPLMMGEKIYSATPRYRGDLLSDERKQEIRESIARAKAKLAAMTPEELAEFNKRIGI